MRPVSFSEQNCVMGQGQEEYLPLPVHRGAAPYSNVVSCWELSAAEIELLQQNGGKIWVQQLTFGGPLQPQLISVESPFGPDGQLVCD